MCNNTTRLKQPLSFSGPWLSICRCPFHQMTAEGLAVWAFSTVFLLLFFSVRSYRVLWATVAVCCLECRKIGGGGTTTGVWNRIMSTVRVQENVRMRMCCFRKDLLLLRLSRSLLFGYSFPPTFLLLPLTIVFSSAPCCCVVSNEAEACFVSTCWWVVELFQEGQRMVPGQQNIFFSNSVKTLGVLPQPHKESIYHICSQTWLDQPSVSF